MGPHVPAVRQQCHLTEYKAGDDLDDHGHGRQDHHPPGVLFVCIMMGEEPVLMLPLSKIMDVLSVIPFQKTIPKSKTVNRKRILNAAHKEKNRFNSGPDLVMRLGRQTHSWH